MTYQEMVVMPVLGYVAVKVDKGKEVGLPVGVYHVMGPVRFSEHAERLKYGIDYVCFNPEDVHKIDELLSRHPDKAYAIFTIVGC